MGKSETEAAAKLAGHEAFEKARAAGADVTAADEAATAAYRDAGGTNPELLESLPEAVVGPEELALMGAIVPAAEVPKPSTHCPECGAPAWAAVPNRVGKS